MLVKLGGMWVVPEKVVFMEPDSLQDTVRVVTAEGDFVTAGKIDDFAGIINTAGQSFGGEEDEKPKDA